MDRDILGTRMLGSGVESAPLWDHRAWFSDDLLWHVSAGAVRAIVTAYLCPAPHQRIPPQYEQLVASLADHEIQASSLDLYQDSTGMARESSASAELKDFVATGA
jgi:hypothetical protein